MVQRKILHRRIAIFLLTLLLSPALRAGGASVEDIETAYIYNFAKFIEWPERQSARLRVCVLGEGNLGQKLAALNRKSLKKKRIEVSKIEDIVQAGTCDMLVLPDLSPLELKKINALARKHHIVTVSNRDAYARKGVMINFFIEKKRVRFAINHRSVKEAGIRVSSKLLRVAKVVE